ncbi:aldehyde dehydrogenase [Heterostelium album PN500]|uniref:Aldehyde dehydrogenase n=1 Tax=Heterostelium pallidum (strain ATCC 26659 / Pp 5 / PN500) TaxID=670386 RepID=D3BKN4_HETP5|nr:aldehyde dehydrogenase [Heterostelium album PN500]EFA78464.1 aldehyde dehydrogenase [Heterostelium album PN500]|eukprot:XP_020430588.1 aldehyde dehydrogenase [Heterostelium album PN500]
MDQFINKFEESVQSTFGVDVKAYDEIVGYKNATFYLSWALSTIIAFMVVRWLFGSSSARLPKREARPVGVSPASKGTGPTIECVNPATGKLMGTVKALKADEVKQTLEAARIAQAEWAETSFAERKQVLQDFIDMFIKYEKEIVESSMRDTGKTRFEATFGEILTSCEKLRYLINYGEDALKTQKRRVPMLMGTKSARLEYHPLGVIGIIIPWNYPVHSIISAAAAAIFSGNAALVKVSEWSTYSKVLFEQLIREVLAKRGHNPDLIQLLPGMGETGEALVRSGVDKILFIGSPATGKRVMKAASDNLTPVILELGGKDPMIVFDDVDLDWAMGIVQRGCFINLGQNCISSERVFVHERVYDKFAKSLADLINSLKQGPPESGQVDFGSMTMPAQVDKVEHLVNTAIKEGAKCLAGGKRHPEHKVGHFFMPTVLANVTEKMTIFNEEAFGPVATLVKFSNEDDLVRMVNGTAFGLGCSILTSDLARAERIGKRVQTGMLTINDYGASYLVQDLPFGGCKESGFGRFNGPEGLRGFSREVSVLTDRFGIKTPVPRLIRYPIDPAAVGIIRQAIFMIYQAGVFNKIRAAISFTSQAIRNPKLLM